MHLGHPSGWLFCFSGDRNRESPQVGIGILRLACIVMTEGVGEAAGGVVADTHNGQAGTGFQVLRHQFQAQISGLTTTEKYGILLKIGVEFPILISFPSDDLTERTIMPTNVRLGVPNRKLIVALSVLSLSMLSLTDGFTVMENANGNGS